MKKVSIIIPVYNEKATIDKILKEVKKANTCGLQKEIIIIDDYSSDGTIKKLKKLKTSKSLKIFFHKKNQGKGAALRTGFKKATGDLILIQDADLEYDPDDYPSLIEPIKKGVTKIVYGSRFLGPHLSSLFWYTLGNKLVTLITNILFNSNLTDMETGYKVFKREILKDIKLKATRFDFEPEFTAQILKKGYRILEVPISYYSRGFEDGKKLTWRDGVMAVFTLFKERFIS